ncbi:MAG TPA: MBL fold metallo-hydrolase [Gemmatimonadaceae bacterium]|nr:MBL fold metallo-hydrolase [Gemmatimonadaceae bacterium]
MTDHTLHATYIGGPTALIEVSGLRLLTDPTFDVAGTTYETPVYTLRKATGPAVGANALGTIDAVLLSHDHHFDNLDRAGRAVLSQARQVFAPAVAAERLGGGATPLAPWTSATVAAASGRRLRVTGTPARHGPPGGDRGPCIGFLLDDADQPTGARTPAVYVSGDTVWYEALEEISRRANVRVAFLFMGAARVREVGPAHLTMTADEGVLAARAMPDATIVPLHFEGWAHFSEGRVEIEQAFAAAGLTDRLRWLAPGQRTSLGDIGRP